MHNSHENQWEYYIVEGIMDTYARVSPFWVIILTWLTKNKFNQKKQILRVERELLIIFWIPNISVSPLKDICQWNNSNQNIW